MEARDGNGASNLGVEFDWLPGWSLVFFGAGLVFAVFVGGCVVEVFEEAGEVFGGGEAYEAGEVFDGELGAVGQDGGGAAHFFFVDVVAEFAVVFGFEHAGEVGAVDVEVAGDGLNVESSQFFLFATQHVLDNSF